MTPEKQNYIIVSKYENLETEKISHLCRRYQKAFDLFLNTKLVNEYNINYSEPADFSSYFPIHSRDYIKKLMEIEDKNNISTSNVLRDIIAFEKNGVGGTIKAIDFMNKNGNVVFHIGGGYHHGEQKEPKYNDYCNDVAIALHNLILKGYKNILYIDLDFHYPNGVLNILKDESKIFSLSLHGWPSEEKSGWPSINKNHISLKNFSVPLPEHIGDRTYNETLYKAINFVTNEITPDCIFYQAGADIHHKDLIGNFNLSMSGIYNRDLQISKLQKNFNIPLIGVVGGGYNEIFTPKIIVNTLAALVQHQIIFNENQSIGATNDKKSDKWFFRALEIYKKNIRNNKI